MDDDFSVRFRLEYCTFTFQFIAQSGKILYDPIMDQDHIACHAHMGVSISGVWFPMGRPAGMTNANVTI